MGKIVYNGREYLSAGTASTMQGATSTTDGVSGLVPQPLIADREKFLKGDGTWGTANEVTANPQDTPTDELTSIDIDGTVYEIASGSGDIYGAFIDTNRKLASIQVATGQDWSYTATEDCWVTINPWNTSNSTPSQIYVDNVELIAVYNARPQYTLYLKKGQVLLIKAKTDYTYGQIFGLTFGTSNIFTPIIYSTEEREVGVWTDGKPLYQKTFIITGKQSQIDISSLNIDTYVKSESVYRIGSYCFEMPRLANVAQNYDTYLSTYYAELNSGNITFLWGTGVSSIDELHFTIQYTKTTDVAGSGSYNTLGVPTVHYDGNEKVIGTWFGETLYQKTFDLSVNITSTSRTWYIILSSTDIQNYNMDKIFIDQSGSYAIDPHEDTIYPIPYSTDKGGVGGLIGFAIDGGAVRLCIADASTGTLTGKLTLRYTKITTS